jgi:catechol 2,3-dioxygenase-like lactoylglutathione lyase family enzyme
LNNSAKLTYISIITKDVKRLSDFYETILNIKDKFVAGEDYVELKTSSCVVAVESAASLERRSNISFNPNAGNNILLEFKVDNVDDDYTPLEKLGVDIVCPLTDSSWGTRGFYFRDPDGNLVDFFSETKKNWGV